MKTPIIAHFEMIYTTPAAPEPRSRPSPQFSVFCGSERSPAECLINAISFQQADHMLL